MQFITCCCCILLGFFWGSGLCAACFRCVGGAGWYVGKARASCSATCFDAQLVCTEEQLEAHNDDVDTTSKIDAIIIAKTGNARPGSRQCSSLFWTNSDAPNYHSKYFDGDCHLSKAGRALTTFNCDTQATTADDKHRLCYCHASQFGQDFILIDPFSRHGLQPPCLLQPPSHFPLIFPLSPSPSPLLSLLRSLSLFRFEPTTFPRFTG
jgi:hypothetical protein